MSIEQSEHRRQWRDYQTESGARPVKDFLFSLPDEDQAAIYDEMTVVRKKGKSAARHIRNEIYEVRACYDTKIYRILFASEGRFNHILLSLDGFQKKSRKTSKADIELAEQRLADWRRRGKAEQSTQVRRIKGAK